MQPFDSAVISTVIENDREVFRTLANRAQLHASKKQYEAASAYAQLAGEYAWHNHPGLFQDDQLELMLNGIGKSIAPEYSGPRATRAGECENVLHVLTTAYETGGHTRLVWRWIRNDSSRRHSVVITRQAHVPLPGQLMDAVTAVGGELNVLDRTPGGFISRAHALKAAMAKADQIILHIHPSDVIPNIALSGLASPPPVVLMNHTEHIFWFGTHVTDLVAHLRDEGIALTIEKRGIGRANCAVLPIPLTPPKASNRLHAKRAFGFAEDTIVLLTVASAYKYRTGGGSTFIDTLTPLLKKHEKLVLIAVGPGGPLWETASQSVGGRIHICGEQKMLDGFYGAADVYLDSFPFGSLTAVLEAGMHQLPILRLEMFPASSASLNLTDPGLKEVMLSSTDVADYEQTLERLIEDETFRLNVGRQTREKVLRTHTGDGWGSTLADIYAMSKHLATQRRSAIKPRTQVDQPADIDLWTAWLQQVSGIKCSLQTLLQRSARSFPLNQRLSVWWNRLSVEGRISAGTLLPESIGTNWEKRILQYR